MISGEGREMCSVENDLSGKIEIVKIVSFCNTNIRQLLYCLRFVFEV